MKHNKTMYSFNIYLSNLIKYCHANYFKVLIRIQSFYVTYLFKNEFIFVFNSKTQISIHWFTSHIYETAKAGPDTSHNIGINPCLSCGQQESKHGFSPTLHISRKPDQAEKGLKPKHLNLGWWHHRLHCNRYP